MADVSCTPACRNCRVHEQCWVCVACWSVSYVVEFYYCWIWQLWIVFYVEDCGVSSAECYVHLVGVDRVNVCTSCITGGVLLICSHLCTTLLEWIPYWWDVCKLWCMICFTHCPDTYLPRVFANTPLWVDLPTPPFPPLLPTSCIGKFTHILPNFHNYHEGLQKNV